MRQRRRGNNGANTSGMNRRRFFEAAASLGAASVLAGVGSQANGQTTTPRNNAAAHVSGRRKLGALEVSSVGLGKWRAQIARVPGGSAALMPFYGKTPDEAARHLSQWLEIAHGQPRTRI